VATLNQSRGLPHWWTPIPRPAAVDTQSEIWKTDHCHPVFQVERSPRRTRALHGDNILSSAATNKIAVQVHRIVSMSSQRSQPKSGQRVSARWLERRQFGFVNSYWYSERDQTN
jgi:hypothetical protein